MYWKSDWLSNALTSDQKNTNFGSISANMKHKSSKKVKLRVPESKDCFLFNLQTSATRSPSLVVVNGVSHLTRTKAPSRYESSFIKLGRRLGTNNHGISDSILFGKFLSRFFHYS